MFTEAYLEPSQTYMMELFCENSWRLVAINYICKKAPWYIYVLLGYKCASDLLDEPYEMAPLNCFILQFLCHN